MSPQGSDSRDGIDRASLNDLVTLARGQSGRLPAVPRLRRRLQRAPLAAGAQCGWMTSTSTWTNICPPSSCRPGGVLEKRPCRRRRRSAVAGRQSSGVHASGPGVTPLGCTMGHRAERRPGGADPGHAPCPDRRSRRDRPAGCARGRQCDDTFPQPPPTRWSLARAAWRGRVARMTRTAQRVQLGFRGLGELGVGSRPPTLAARTSLNRPTGPRRRLTTVDVSLADVVTAAHRQSCTVNDLVLAAATGALSAVLHRRGERPTELVISVPVSAQPSPTSSATRQGSRSCRSQHFRPRGAWQGFGSSSTSSTASG